MIIFSSVTNKLPNSFQKYTTNTDLFKVDLFKGLYFTVQHLATALTAFLTEEICGREDDGFIYLVTLLLAGICGFKGRERPSRCDDFAGAWAAETWFSQLPSFHGITVVSVCYMRSANIRYGSVHCSMLLFAPQGQTTSVCPPSPLLLNTPTLTLLQPTNTQWLHLTARTKYITVWYSNFISLLFRLTTMAWYLSWERCLSSHLWLFQSPGTEGLWHRSGLMWTTVELGESSTERARSLPSWGGPQVMSRRTFQSSPTSTQHGSSSLRGFKLLSLEAIPWHRYKLTLYCTALPLPCSYCLKTSVFLWKYLQGSDSSVKFQLTSPVNILLSSRTGVKKSRYLVSCQLKYTSVPYLPPTWLSFLTS